MKSGRLCLLALFLASGLLLMGNSTIVSAQDVKLDSPTFQALLDRLFGTPTADGLLEGTQHFALHAENVVLTPTEAALFFVPSPTNPADLTDLIAAAEKIKGAELKIEGVFDGDPFALKIAGKEVKGEGLVLTQAEFDALIAELKGISTLREVKIEATVDGKLVTLKMENMAGRVRIEDRELRGKDAHLDARGGARLANDNRDRSDKVEKLERVERPERIEKIERPEKIERIERPEVSHGGPGRG